MHDVCLQRVEIHAVLKVMQLGAHTHATQNPSIVCAQSEGRIGHQSTGWEAVFDGTFQNTQFIVGLTASQGIGDSVHENGIVLFGIRSYTKEVIVDAVGHGAILNRADAPNGYAIVFDVVEEVLI